MCLGLQLSARLQEIEGQTTERISELETQLMQATKETELLKVRDATAHAQSLERRPRQTTKGNATIAVLKI